MGLEVPGRARIDYHRHEVDSPQPITTQVPLPDHVEIHVGGGFTRLEAAALELAKSACHGCADQQVKEDGAPEGDSTVEPENLGRWAARAAAELLAECRAIQSALGEAAPEPVAAGRASPILQP